jgi:hypothetical protein
MTKEQQQREQQLDQKIELAISSFSQRHLSNSKWVRLIEVLVKNTDQVKKVQFKKVHEDEIGELYLVEGTIFNFDYYQVGFEGNNSFGGWLIFKEIEYLIFPKQIDIPKGITQDLEKIMNLISSIGRFSFNLDSEKLKLNCYDK